MLVGTGLVGLQQDLLTWLALVASFGVLQQRELFLLQLAKTYSTHVTELLLLFVQGLDLKYQPALPGQLTDPSHSNGGHVRYAAEEHRHLAVLGLCFGYQPGYSFGSKH